MRALGEQTQSKAQKGSPPPPSSTSAIGDRKRRTSKRLSRPPSTPQPVNVHRQKQLRTTGTCTWGVQLQ